MGWKKLILFGSRARNNKKPMNGMTIHGQIQIMKRINYFLKRINYFWLLSLFLYLW